MKKRIRKFVAAVQELYCEYIDVCTKIGRGYRDLEKDYIPPHLYLAMFRKIAEYNEIPWDSEEFFKEMSCNRKKEYYCSNDLIQEILKSLGEKEWSGYKITEYYCEVELKSGTEMLVISSCLFRQESILNKAWMQKNEKFDSKNNLIEKDFFRDKGLVIIYYLLFETNSKMEINEEYKEKYSEIWKGLLLNETEQCEKEKNIILRYLVVIVMIYKKMYMNIENRDTENEILIIAEKLFEGTKYSTVVGDFKELNNNDDNKGQGGK